MYGFFELSSGYMELSMDGDGRIENYLKICGTVKIKGIKL